MCMAFCSKYNIDCAACLRNAIDFLITLVYKINFRVIFYVLKLNTVICSSKYEVNCELVVMKLNIVVPTYCTLNCHLLCFIFCLYSKPVTYRMTEC